MRSRKIVPQVKSESGLTVAFVSGKGGVGKTMLAVAFAKELSRSNRTLIIDLDFFNRGLTGLMGAGIKQCDVTKPSFLLENPSQNSEDSEKWSISQVADNLFHLVYPDLLPDEMSKFETLDIQLLKESFKQFIEEVRKQCNCECVVLDCHGGPDNASFAACLVADYTLLISEPDRITFYGTLNFLRQLQRVSDQEEPNIYLVFNKVVPAFSAIFLRTLYNRLIRQHFSGRQLLAVFPLEVYLTKEFEKTPFLTEVYPKSYLAKKTQTMIYELLVGSHPEKLSRSIASMPRLMRSYRKVALGKPLPILDLNVVISAIVACLVFIVLVDFSLSYLFAEHREALRKDLRRVHVYECLREAPDWAANTEVVSGMIDSESGRLFDFESQYEPYDNSESREKFIRRRAQAERYQVCIANKVGEAKYYYISRFQLPSLRKQALQSDNSNSVPPAYKNDYLAAITRLRQASLLYIGLETVSGVLQPISGLLAYLGVGWLTIVLLANWSLILDRRFTYNSRQGRYARSVGLLVLVMAVWLLPLILLNTVIVGGIVNAVRYGSVLSIRNWVAFTAGILAIATPMTFVIVQLFSIYRDVRYERHYIEDGMRLLFVAYLVAIPLLVYFYFSQQ